MEKLLHYTWRHKMFPLGEMRTTDGRLVEVISPGLYNRGDGGPDFFNAKLKVDGLLWVGNVELHLKASDWYRHHHDTDAAYDSVVMHVVADADMDVETSKGNRLPALVLPISEDVRRDYATLLSTERYPPCYMIIPGLQSLKVHAWMAALQTERMEQKTVAMAERVKRLNGSWEDGYFATLARNYGFSINGEAFDVWIQHIPMRAVDHHRDNLFQVETLFLGQAGLLHREPSITLPKDGHTLEEYRREYAYLQKKFGLTPMDPSLWRYLRTRPQNFPHVRLLELARMYCEHRTGLSELLECKDVKAVGNLYGIKGAKLALLVINTVVPSIFAYGRSHAKEYLCERAFDMLESLKPEDNHIIRMWKECGLDVKDAGDSQALIQLKKEYCDRKECLRCRFGHEFLSGEYRNMFLREEDIN